jgi:hypothetical protein
MEQLKNNWIDYFYTLNLLLLKSKNEAQFNKKVEKLSEQIPDVDLLSVFNDDYYSEPYIWSQRTIYDENNIETIRYKKIKKMFGKIKVGSIIAIRDNETLNEKTKKLLKKLFVVVAIDSPRKKFKEKTGKQAKQNAYTRMLLKYYKGNNDFDKTEGVYSYSIFPAYPVIPGMKEMNEGYEQLGGYVKSEDSFIENAFKNDDTTSDNYFNIFELKNMFMFNNYSFNLIEQPMMYIGKQSGTYNDNKEFLIDEDYK